MPFFDLSIPFIENSGATALDARSRRDSRLKTVARAMELGYTAVAYNRPFRGILSDADRCQIVPFSPQSFLESIVGISPAAFAASVALHRDLLGVPRASHFRQYTRLTVSVDSVAAASALNRGNRLLRSYDLVAVRPLNQMGFDQACSASEVDIISLNFSHKLPFRLKLGMVQAAVKRGVHFEISYSHIIDGDHARRQILSEAKRLGDWTRGKNLIISSSAASFNEVRGPYDVANLSTVLLGLTMERAKAALSRNCRSLVANALRKRDCYFKEAIRIERILPEENMDSQGDWFKEWSDWDPISSGENDLPSLDDMTMLFCAASKHSKSQNTLDFTSNINGMATNASIFSCTFKKELDFSNSKQHDDVDHAFAKNTAFIVAKSLANTTNEETKPCSDEDSMVIDVLENPSRAEMSISDGLSSKGPDSNDVHGVGMISTSSMGHEDVEIRDQVVDGADFAQTLRNANNSLDCSFVSPRDEISMANNVAIIASEEHYSEKMDIKEKFSSTGNVQLNACPDKMEAHERLLLTIEAGSSEYPNITSGMEQLTLPLETSISEEAQVNIYQENQPYSSTSIVLSDSPAKLEMLAGENIFSRRNNSKGFLSKTKDKKKRLSTVEITKVDEFSENLTTSLKENHCSSLENDSSLEGQNIQRPVKAAGITNRHLHKSGSQRVKRRSHCRGYLLTAKSLCKPLVFKKKTTRLRRMCKFM